MNMKRRHSSLISCSKVYSMVTHTIKALDKRSGSVTASICPTLVPNLAMEFFQAALK